MKESAGTLLYRKVKGKWHALVVEPAGFAAKWGWSIPKGLPDPKESLEAAARRETREETGCVAGELEYLGKIEYRRSRKRVHCFAGPAGEGDPRPDTWEVSRAEFLPLDEAREKLHPDQRAFIDWLRAKLG